MLSPYSAEDARGLLKAAIRDPNPVVFLENELMYGVAFPMSEASLGVDFLLPIGKAKVRGGGGRRAGGEGRRARERGRERKAGKGDEGRGRRGEPAHIRMSRA